ncbi:phosphoribosylaminoimidazole carboxylase, ATPase subunit [Parvularcula bermudensis HTCC2503]|uniref:N5-carboxyaminoimidazole ribonucleotide synthase n=1 Tax=Parvularcula bermudensis (strain ATCC BAA-594 / HTCC2503 / KCTC 12087) TaxID=314260 RepID=E0TDH5_PARBH|nr:5-(carboxyamino)imidazole ribonucleotide synthase [Parvularcula bermudensis]ADM08730.1 phosphoribosylaminoimidazole carboxylase, ATPase subunit [Parvularcula bermudensis HTCC2503]
MNGALSPGATIGILGAGQLGRMLATAAARLGFRVHTFSPETSPPAAQVAAHHVPAAYDDEDALAAFAEGVDAATFEFENIPPQTVSFLRDRGVPVRPDDKVLAVCQDRLAEKAFLEAQGIVPAPHAQVDGRSDLEAALARLGPDAILKTRRFGYDGKGQKRLSADTPLGAVDDLLTQPCVLEQKVPFTAEFSVIGARGEAGDVAFYEPSRNDHAGGILRRSTVPASLPPAPLAAAQAAVRNCLMSLDYVGVLAVEFFWGEETGLIANEMAPRVHNSGHWTHEACLTSQFEQHIRAVAGWPLGLTDRHSDAVMENILGAEVDDWARLAGTPGLAVTLYGKADQRPGRKMGHTVRLSPKRG